MHVLHARPILVSSRMVFDKVVIVAVILINIIQKCHQDFSMCEKKGLNSAKLRN